MGVVVAVVVAVVGAVVVFRLMQYLTAKSSINPFKEDARTEVKPKVTDQKQRDAVLKQGFSQHKVPPHLDAIIIGSGLGGLTAAAILARAQKKVLVLEQHDRAGGSCHTFLDKGYEFDVGIHYIGKAREGTIAKTLIDQITGGQLQFEPLDDIFDEVIFAEKEKEPRVYPVFGGRGRWEYDLKQRFPHEADSIARFFQAVDEVSEVGLKTMAVKLLPLSLVRILQSTGIYNYLTDFYKWNARTCKEVVWDMVKTQELRDILCYAYGDFGTPLSKAAFPILALILSHYCKDGAMYPVGGASEIAFNMIPVIEAAGGKVLVRAEVTQILVRERRVVGVEVRKGGNVVTLAAPLVISNAGVFNTMESLLPKSIASKSRLWPFVLSHPHSISCLTVFIGINSSAENLNIIHKRNAWIYSENNIDKLMENYLSLSREEAMKKDIPLLFLSFSSTKDPLWEMRFPGKTTLSLTSVMPYEWVSQWETHPVMRRGEEYEFIKNTFGHKAVEQACTLFPDIREHIDYISIGTPVSIRHYLGTSKGQIFGLDHTSDHYSFWNNAILRPKTDIPGLYLTGQDVCSCGFIGALFGGMLCASSVLQRNVISDLTSLHRRIRHGKDKKV